MSLKDLMHAITAYPQMTATQAGQVNTVTAQRPSGNNKKLFHGMVEVQQVANGYIVNIGRREGYEYETHIATSIVEVNKIIAAQIVAFKLEDKS